MIDEFYCHFKLYVFLGKCPQKNVKMFGYLSGSVLFFIHMLTMVSGTPTHHEELFNHVFRGHSNFFRPTKNMSAPLQGISLINPLLIYHFYIYLKPKNSFKSSLSVRPSVTPFYKFVKYTLVTSFPRLAYPCGLVLIMITLQCT